MQNNVSFDFYVSIALIYFRLADDSDNLLPKNKLLTLKINIYEKNYFFICNVASGSIEFWTNSHVGNV